MKMLSSRLRAACLGILILTGLLCACATIRSGSHYDESNDFDRYRTFSWIADDPYVGRDAALNVSPLTQRKIQQAIRDQLEFKGYTFVDDRDTADFVVSYTIGSREKFTASSYPIAYRGSWSWDMHDRYYRVGEYVEHSYTEGTLGVDIFDAATKQPVWHGWAQKTITQGDRDDPSVAIQDGVQRLFESFPR
ncbi:MAG TPA: DUF4136 domain-containing protein [Woeseiaceae bacterium]|nr:DUF4136 domain-containing protein [Woeseiaceae bacterium]